jgi:hypothetical protein
MEESFLHLVSDFRVLRSGSESVCDSAGLSSFSACHLDLGLYVCYSLLLNLCAWLIFSFPSAFLFFLRRMGPDSIF